MVRLALVLLIALSGSLRPAVAAAAPSTASPASPPTPTAAAPGSAARPSPSAPGPAASPTAAPAGPAAIPLLDSFGILDTLSSAVSDTTLTLLEQRLGAAAGRPVRIGALEAGLATGIVLKRVAVLDGGGGERATIDRVVLTRPTAPKATLSDLRASLPLAGGSSLRVEEAELDLSAGVLVLKSASLEAGNTRVSISGRVEQVGGAPVLAGLELRGAFDVAAALRGWTGTVTVTAVASGPLARPRVSGTARSPRLSGGGRSLALDDVTARFTTSEDRVTVESLRAELAGGNLSGSLWRPWGGEASTHLDVSLEGLHLPGGPGRPVSGGRISVSLAGTVGRSLDSLAGKGRLTIDGLVVDLSSNEALADARRKLQSASSVAALADRLAGSSRFSGVAAEIVEQVRFYRAVLEELGVPHTLGRITSPVKVAGGRLACPSLSGPHLSGHVAVTLAERRLDGHLDRLGLGRVGLGGIALSGSLARPAVTVDRSRLTLDGRPPPRSRSFESLSALLQKGGSSGSIPVAAIVEALLGGSRSGRSSTGAGSDPAGRILDLLLRQRGRATGQESAPAPRPADRQQRIRENLERILRGDR